MQSKADVHLRLHWWQILVPADCHSCSEEQSVPVTEDSATRPQQRTSWCLFLSFCASCICLPLPHSAFILSSGVSLRCLWDFSSSLKLIFTVLWGDVTKANSPERGDFDLLEESVQYWLRLNSHTTGGCRYKPLQQNLLVCSILKSNINLKFTWTLSWPDNLSCTLPIDAHREVHAKYTQMLWWAHVHTTMQDLKRKYTFSCI